jgi:hypothetical protein
VILVKCLEAKAENRHQREILALEKEFESTKNNIEANFEAQLKRLYEEISDRDKDIGELRELKKQLKIEIQQRDKTIDILEASQKELN